MGADIVNQAMSMGSMIQMAMESLVSPTITAVTTALFTAMFVGRKTEQKGLAGTKTTIFEEEIRTLLDNGRLSYREFNQIKNYLEVAEKADEFHKECGYDKVEPNTQYDIDWFIRFFDAASNVSNEDLQKIWAKLLAGETICKGCFSLRAIETLYNMSPDEARLFSEIADIKSGKINCIIVKDLSRLGRNYIEMGKYLEQIFPMMGMMEGVLWYGSNTSRAYRIL